MTSHLIKNGRINPAEIAVISRTPDHRSKGSVFNQGPCHRRVRLANRGNCRLDVCIDTLLFDPAVNDSANVAIHRIGVIEIGGHANAYLQWPVYGDQPYAGRLGK